MDHPGGNNLLNLHRYTIPQKNFCIQHSAMPIRQLWQHFIILDMPISAALRLDNVMAVKCLQNLKSADISLSGIKALLFLDAVGQLSDLLDKVSSNESSQ